MNNIYSLAEYRRYPEWKKKRLKLDCFKKDIGRLDAFFQRETDRLRRLEKAVSKLERSK